jgi:hypothetical protein
MDRHPFLDSVVKLKSDVESTIVRLADSLGADVWTRWGYRQAVVFGTADWDPAITIRG